MEAITTTATAVRKEVKKSSVTIDKVYVGDYQKEGTKSCQLRQVVETTSYYPSKQISNNMQDNPFSLGEFGFEEQAFPNKENRVAWIDVPAALSQDDVLGRLPKDCCLYKVLSNRPILTNNQAYAIDEGIRTMDEFASTQIVRYGENSPLSGQIVKDDNGKPQYRQIFYSNTPKEDIDLRNASGTDYYASAAIIAELNGASTIAGQEI
jgi:hypothetical protein